MKFRRKQLLTLNKRKRGEGLGSALLVVDETDGVAWRAYLPRKGSVLFRVR